MNKTIFATFALLGLASLANATVTLGFSTSSSKLTGLANAAGTITDGMIWGIVVDTAGDGFDSGAGSYDGFTIPAAGPANQTFLSVNSVATDDLFFRDDASFLTATFGGTDGGSGAVGTIDNIPYTNGISLGDSFAIMWLATSTAATGDDYGFLTNAGFTMPSDPGTYTGYAALFTGADAARPADQTFGPTGIPEPSRVVLLGLGALGIFARRRRS